MGRLDDVPARAELTPALSDLLWTTGLEFSVVACRDADFKREQRKYGYLAMVLIEPDGAEDILLLPQSVGIGGGVWLAEAAEALQDLVIEALPGYGLPSDWPSCPWHPATHPLQSGVVDNAAVWSCPTGSGVAARIGDLKPIEA